MSTADINDETTGPEEDDAEFTRRYWQHQRRHLLRNNSPLNSSNIWKRMPWTLGIIAITVAVYLLVEGGWRAASIPSREIFHLGGVTPTASGQWWRLLAAIFLHLNLFHILGNMFSLYILGSLLEPLVQPWLYLIVYFGSGVFGNYVELELLPAQAHTVAAGASGAIFGLVGALLASTIGRRAGEATRRWIFTMLILNVFFDAMSPAIAWQAHAGGFVAGFVILFVYEKLGGYVR